MVDRFLDCDDPGIAGDALDQFGYLRGRAISLGARLRLLVSLARVEVNQAQEQEKKDAEDLPGDMVDRLVRETDVEPSSS